MLALDPELHCFPGWAWAAVFQALDLDPEVFEYFACTGRWRQNPKALDRKGDNPGRIEIGFNCGEREFVPEKKQYHWLNYILFPQEPTAAGIRALQNLVEHPLTLSVKNLPPRESL